MPRTLRQWVDSARCKMWGCCVLVCLLLISSGAAAGSAPSPAEDSYGQFDFPTCVRYALVHSDQFLKNRIQIQIKSMDLKDAHADLWPTVSIQTQYYLVAPPDTITSPLTYNITMTNWNPFAALLKIKTQGLMVDMARLSHFDKLAAGVRDIAKLFINIDVQKKNLKAAQQIAALSRNKVSYGESLAQQGGKMDPLELTKLATTARQNSIKVKDTEKDLAESIGKLKAILGYHPDYYLPLDTRDTVNQILAGFNGRGISFPEIESENWSLKISAKKEQVQSCAVTGAYVALLPQPSMVFQGNNNQVNAVNGLTASFGFNYILWDTFKRVRDIKRQKLNTRLANLEREELAVQLYQSYSGYLKDIDITAEKESLKREESKLAELVEDKTYVQYKAGDIPMDVYLDKKIARVETSMAAVTALQQRVNALLELATLAGGLNRFNVRINY